ncbi:hypothetical protein GGTG_01169 [Gaeumannomyces tritici R3-111a-1]|uniref:DUF7719 domain-containing protein n=1 Tax=Gaeumannomyces tritici (strain R3-111a-1) TaxID=644352 RepID=J3NIT5_GAET3|nr:hypothetical protein GGTG_01169 [Gaeumannomyces tritici R3-111a-1]EJT81185.1 hypothetical protein GGTG_01169 [Gaeumannomyces tritici R3-111a-1]
MARQRDAGGKIKLKQPDRSGPSEKTLLDMAQERNLFKEAEMRQRANDAKKKGLPPPSEPDDDDDGELSPTADRIMEVMMWTVSLCMLHVTLDVLVQNQYAVELSWSKIAARAGQGFLVFGFLVYVLHSHAANPAPFPLIPQRFQSGLRQAVFLAAGTAAGCYLIHITNEHGYLAVMKQAPSIGCLWVWAILELNLSLSVLSLGACYTFLWQGGYSLK